MATLLLTHGAFQGGWVWQKTALLLRARGHAVHAPTLSGCGYLARTVRPEDDLNGSIQDMTNYLDMEDLKDVVIVGHSFSGLICGALMMQCPARIRQAIFVDAAIPQSNRSFVEIAGEQFSQMLQMHRLENDLVRPWPAKVFGVAEPEATWFEARLRPFPYRAFHTPFPGVFDPAKTPTSHIACLQTMSPFIREMAEKARAFSWPTYELDSGHCPMITCPEQLVEIMDAILQSGATNT
ncbi:alpha/beta fold hydrolase [Desulfobulbus sp.]|uniref:alpha/beta fold hydrolase n=1 Tax=Desulfobulbus sp. TaxID=895 RepID=UPI0027BA8CAD|nr:alpha/beta hydrolase [Desulfobulbus sp.]